MALGVGALLFTTGCTAEFTGLAGVSVDERGTPIAVVVACKGNFDGASLEDVSNFDVISVVREWSFGAARTVRWNIVESPTATHPKPAGTMELNPKVPYDLSAFSRDEQTRSVGVTFTVADLARLRPGQVRYFKENESGGTGKYVVADVSKFESLACQEIAILS
jgi:hypothetical protein